MAVWTGWLADVLAGIGAPDTTDNRQFLTEWESSERTACRFNPLAVRLPLPGSNRCKELPNGLYAQSYTTKADGLAATVAQFALANHAAIVAALKTGDPFTIEDPATVEKELGLWSADTFAAKYATQAQAPAPTPPPAKQSDIAYLEGGPCDGTTHTLTAGEKQLDLILCKNAQYVGTAPATFHDGDHIFKYAFTFPKPGQGTVLNAPDALGGWKALRKSVNVSMPHTLDHSQHVTKATLRTIARAGKVRL